MSINNAITFIGNADTCPELREACYSCHTQQELIETVKAQGLDFTPDEFAEAIIILLFKCQTFEQADRVIQMEGWFSLFR